MDSVILMVSLKDVDVSIKDGKIQQIGQISEKAKEHC